MIHKDSADRSLWDNSDKIKNTIKTHYSSSKYKEPMNDVHWLFENISHDNENEKTTPNTPPINTGSQVPPGTNPDGQVSPGTNPGGTTQTLSPVIGEPTNPASTAVQTTGLGPNSSQATNSNCSSIELSIGAREQFKQEIMGQIRNAIKATIGNVNATGTDRSDRITGSTGNDVLSGLGCNDFISGNSGSDHISGGGDNDYLRGGSENDFINGNSDNDLIFGDRGDDTLRGGSGDDILNGNDGNDILYGDKGRDIFLLSPGQDTIADFEIGADSIGIQTEQTYTLSHSDQGLLINRAELGTTLVMGVSVEEFNSMNHIINL